jgi:alpha-tubulin suppressor-like RCC1 family protein
VTTRHRASPPPSPPQARAHADATDAEFELGADLEERGSVYVVGANAAGQLGLGDDQPREYFAVVPETRGAGVAYVSAGYDMTFAVTEDHDVLVSGSGTRHRLAVCAVFNYKLPCYLLQYS